MIFLRPQQFLYSTFQRVLNSQSFSSLLWSSFASPYPLGFHTHLFFPSLHAQRGCRPYGDCHYWLPPLRVLQHRLIGQEVFTCSEWMMSSVPCRRVELASPLAVCVCVSLLSLSFARVAKHPPASLD